MADSYQLLKSKLDEILNALQSDATDVDEALKLHKEGEAVLKQLEKYLAESAKSAGITLKKI